MNKGIRFTKEDILKSACGPLNADKLNEQPKAKQTNLPNTKGRKTKNWISLQLYAYCKALEQKHNVTFTLVNELYFHPVKKFHFDYAILCNTTKDQIDNKTWSKDSQVVAIEYEGLFSAKSGHTTPTGYTSNTEKYNDAMLLGWQLIRVTAINAKDLFRFVTPAIDQYFQSKKYKA